MVCEDPICPDKGNDQFLLGPAAKPEWRGRILAVVWQLATGQAGR